MNDYVYQRPPLVEVIAEVHWALQKLAAIPEGGVDPLYGKCLEGLRKNSKLANFRYEEKLVPDGVPIEFFSNKPLIRFRIDPKSWPLYQFGPGIFTTNLVPPYKGWKEFRDHLGNGLDALFESYPAASEVLAISRLELKYIDAFQKQHNFSTYSKFLVEGLQMSLQIPSELVSESVAGGAENVTTISDIGFPLKNMPNATGHIKVSPGTANGEPAVIAQFGAVYSGNEKQPNREILLGWFDEAHLEIRRWFELLTTPQVKETFGQKTEI